jgi:hypothetical protein
LTLPSYYTDLLLAAVLVYGLGLYLRVHFRKLDQDFDWREKFPQRLWYQVRFGLLLPLALVMGIEMIYLRWILHIPLAGHPIAYLELPLAFLFLLLLHLTYLFLYYRKHQLILERQLDAPALPNYLVVNSGAKALHIPLEQVAYFIKLERSTFLRTTEGTQFLYDLPLEQISAQLDQQVFFQLNRQLIAHRGSIKAYTSTATRKLAIELAPRPRDTVYVSKARSGHFIKWLARA